MFSQRIFRFALLAVMSALILTAQTGSGTVQGVVRDASAGVIAGANVTIVHTATMGKYSTTTNEVGFFHFPPTQYGSYKITVGAAGMQTWEGEFLLQVGQTGDISPGLTVGAVATQISVAGGTAPPVATTVAVIATK